MANSQTTNPNFGNINNASLMELMNHKQEEIGKMAKDIAEREWELFELNLFVSSLGKSFLQETSKQVQEVKDRAKRGEIKLEEVVIK